MTDRVSSSTLETIRATLARSGGTARPEVRVPPAEASSFQTNIIQVTLGDAAYYSPVVSVGDSVALRGAYANARRARERDGTDRLSEWVTEIDLDFGRTVLLDTIISGSQYGLRPPGTDSVYRVRREPDRDLQDIARSLE